MACVHCYAAGIAGCQRTIFRHPAMIYRGDFPSWRHGAHEQGTERAHLATREGVGMGRVRSDDRVRPPYHDHHWDRAMVSLWSLSDEDFKGVVHAIRQYMAARDRLHSERQPHESRMAPGGAPDPVISPLSPPPEPAEEETEYVEYGDF